VGLATVSACLLPGLALGQGVEWLPLTLDSALAEGERTGKLVMIYVHADHCGQCEQMRIDVWSQAEGAELAAGMIPIRIDSTTREGQDLSRRFPITGLRAVLVIGPGGAEVDRVVGYHDARSFLVEAEPLKSGIDPLPDLETQLAAHPDSLALMIPIFERYLYRMRDADAGALAQRILRLDPKNAHRQSEVALRSLMTYHASIRGDMARSYDYGKDLLDRFPTCSSVGGAVDGTRKAASALGRMEDWKTLMCGLTEKHPGEGRLLYSIAMQAHRAGIQGACFADAARKAGALGMGGARMDSIAARLDPATGRSGR
jgi:hypothetical protein